MRTEHRVAANPQTKPTDLGCESAERLAATIRRHHRYLLLLLSSYADTHFTVSRRVEGWVDLGTAVRVPVPKAVYRSDCRDKDDRPLWDSNMGTLAPQSDVLPLSHRDLFNILWLQNIDEKFDAVLAARFHGMGQSVIDIAVDQWRERLLAYVQTNGGHFRQLLWPCPYPFSLMMRNV